MPAVPASLEAPYLSGISGPDSRVTEMSQLKKGREEYRNPCLSDSIRGPEVGELREWLL
jgi:hypothetical protein